MLLRLDPAVAELDHAAAVGGVLLRVRDLDDGGALGVEAGEQLHHLARLARVQLLFGLKSKAGKAAADCVLTLRGGAGALREWPYPEWERAGNLLATTHDLHEAMLLGSRIALMDKGRIDLLSTPEDFRTSELPLAQAYLETVNL